MIVEQKVQLTYPENLLNRPLIHGLIRQFDLLTNIVEAQVSAQEGYLIVSVRGAEERVQQGLAWMAEQGVQVEVLSETREEA
jgi:ABC-type methionine transport system ATPase subunit